MRTRQYLTQTSLLGTLLLALPAAMSLKAAPAQTNHTVIPFNQIGVVAGQQYTGGGLTVTPDRNGAGLHCIFQRLDGEATREGLWLTSTVTNQVNDRFQVKAVRLGRAACASPLADTGMVTVDKQTVRFERPGLMEEYVVSMDGVRQDFLVTERPVGKGELQLGLAVAGARVEAAAYGAQLVLVHSGRKIAYSRLRVTDATGKELPARIAVLSGGPEPALAVVVNDARAVYPVRIDPTFSDANWISLGIIPGTDGPIYAAAVDGSGNLYIGGEFGVVGNIIVNNIAKWNGSGWSALGLGITGAPAGWTAPEVNSLVASGGNLYAGGGFTDAGGVNATNIAKWNGSSWSALGSGINGYDSYVETLVISGTDLYAGGLFTTAGGVSVQSLAQWNGTSWSALGSGLAGVGYAYVNALVVSGTNLYVGGSFTNAGGVTATNIAQWNGGRWSPLGSGINSYGGTVYALAVSGSTLYAAGSFTNAGGVSANNIAQWNGSSWSPLGSGMNYAVRALAVSGNTLYAGSDFTTAGGVPASDIAQWNGSSWSPLGSGIIGDTYGGYRGSVSALAALGNTLYVAGSFTNAGGVSANNIAQWNGSSWSGLGSYGLWISHDVNALACDNSGNLYVESGIQNLTSAIYEWNGFSWSQLGSGMNSAIYALACDGSGDLYAGGSFTYAGGVLADGIAEWNGSTWSPLGSGILGEVYALTFDKTGNLYAGGFFEQAGSVSVNNIAEWNGTNWSALGPGVGLYANYDQVLSLASDKSGNIYAGGFFSSAGGVNATNIAKWNGSTWSALGLGLVNGGGYALACDSSANLYAGGDFGMAGGISGIAKWNGGSWSALGSGANATILSLVCDSSGNLYAGGLFSTAGGVTAKGIAEWNGSTWSALGSGMGGGDGGFYGDQGYTYGSPSVNALTLDGFGGLYAGGDFYTAGTNGALYIAEALLTGTSTRPPPGSLEVTIAPPGAISAGAQWQVDGGSFQNSGAIVSNLSVGNHTVTFSVIAGWTTPPFQKVAVTSGTTAAVFGTYVQFTYITTNGAIIITGYTGSGGAVVIPGTINGLPVTSIADNAFYDDTSITSLVIDMNVTNIGVDSFALCSGLTNIVLPNTLVSIQGYAFYDCYRLTSVTVPESVTTIGDYAFGASSLASVYFLGNAPGPDSTVFEFDNVTATVYYLPGTIGWGSTFDSVQTALWFLPNPLILTDANGNTNFGVKNNKFGFSVSWATNLSLVMQATTNLTSSVWVAVSTNTLTNGTFYFSDPQWTNYPDRFYRASTATPVDSPPAGMVLIPAGSFTIGDTLDGQNNASPTNVYVSAFYMETNLVSYGQWQTLYNWATNAGYNFDNGGFGNAANQPVWGANWYDVVKWCNARSQQVGLTPVYYTDAGLTQVYTNSAYSTTPAVYANWTANGYRLPTEAEWEKAARGGQSGLRFPWGNTISESQANYEGDTSGSDVGGTAGFSYDLGPNGYNATFDAGAQPYTSPVGYFAANNYGLYDMAGNLLEWCWDWYSYFPTTGSPYMGGTDPHGPVTPEYNIITRVLRGGFWGGYASSARCATRSANFDGPVAIDNRYGFRCVRAH